MEEIGMICLIFSAFFIFEAFMVGSRAHIFTWTTKLVDAVADRIRGGPPPTAPTPPGEKGNPE